MSKQLKLLKYLTFMSSLTLIPYNANASYNPYDEANWGSIESSGSKADRSSIWEYLVKGAADSKNNKKEIEEEDDSFSLSLGFGNDRYAAASDVEEANTNAPDRNDKKNKTSKAKAREVVELEEISDSDEIVMPKAKKKAVKKPKLAELMIEPLTEEDSDLQGDDFINDNKPAKAKKAKSSVKAPAKSPAKTTAKITKKRSSLKRPAEAMEVVEDSSRKMSPEMILKLVKMTKDFKGKKVAFIDFETTSFSARIGGRALSLGIVMIDNGMETLRWEAVFNPDKDSNVGAFKAHGISRSVTRTMPHFQDVADELFSILKEADAIVAHNAKFDWRYMKAEYERSQIINILKKRDCAKLLGKNAPISPVNKEFLKAQLSWINETPHIQDKRMYMFQSRLTTALWLYMYEREVLLKGDLFDEKSGRFGVPFLPTPKTEGAPNVKGYAKLVNSALLAIYKKMEVLKGRTKQEKERIQWKKFESIDISENDNFTPLEIRRKAMLDRQIRAVSVIKKFTFLELEWYKIYDWKRVGNESSVFYNKGERELLGQITGYLNLAHDMVESGLFSVSETPKFLDYEATWVDSLALGKSTLKSGQDISSFKLDSLCDYFGVNRDSRKLNHGALIDSVLLAKVYAKLVGSELVEVAANDNKPAKKRAVVKPAKYEEDEMVMSSEHANDDVPVEDDLIGGFF